MKCYYVPVCGASVSSQRFETLEEADKEARFLTNISGHFWYVRRIEIKEQ